MQKVTITPKVQLPGGNFFLDTDNEMVYETNAVTMSNGFLLFWDRKKDTAIHHKFDFVNYFYDVTTA